MARVNSNGTRRNLIPIVGGVVFLVSLILLTFTTMEMSFTVRNELGHQPQHRNSSTENQPHYDGKKNAKGAGDDENDADSVDKAVVEAPYDPNRLCTQNQYAKSLNMTLSEYAVSMDTWMDNKVEIERVQTQL